MSKMIWVGSAFTSLAIAGRVRRSWLVMYARTAARRVEILSWARRRRRRARKSLIWAAEVKSSRLTVRVAAISVGSGGGGASSCVCLGQNGWVPKPTRRQRMPLGKRWLQRAELLMELDLANCWVILVSFEVKWGPTPGCFV